ncbi:FCD domain-containing protein [Shimia gijangensis]|uniref:FCD domain-containing protein n=1 Tax=Shimia gijangensis TaxID=1470563 RepID=A0A1M6NS80_9RHOB|nr:FCD domain-containing protein [Shimia gijangensis]
MNIIKASGNNRLAEAIGNFAHPLLIQRRFTSFSAERLNRSMVIYLDILDALKAGDSEWASAAMRLHILTSKSGN